MKMILNDKLVVCSHNKDNKSKSIVASPRCCCICGITISKGSTYCEICG